MSNYLSMIENKNVNIHPHVFRHSALENYSNGSHYMCRVLATPRKFTLNELQVVARHDSMDTTKGYLKAKEDIVIHEMFGIKIN